MLHAKIERNIIALQLVPCRMILIRLIRGCKKKKGVEQDVFLILCQLLVLVTCQLYLIGLNGAGEGKNWRSNSAFNYM